MDQVILDTNFIMSCARQKIDFFEEIYLMGMEILIPKEVIKEIEKLSKIKGSANTREDADLAMKLVNRNKYTLIKLKKKNVDDAIKQFSDENPDVIVATLDKELKGRVLNKKLIIRGKKKLQII